MQYSVFKDGKEIGSYEADTPDGAVRQAIHDLPPTELFVRESHKFNSNGWRATVNHRPEITVR